MKTSTAFIPLKTNNTGTKGNKMLDWEENEALSLLGKLVGPHFKFSFRRILLCYVLCYM